MKISRTSLQNYFDSALPNVTELADAFTFHAFEIDSIEKDILDIKVLPNRASDCNTEQGIAIELSAILNLPLKNGDPREAGKRTVSVSLARINGILGSLFSTDEVQDVFDRLGFTHREEGGVFTITPPEVRADIVIPEDIAEEVGRIIGYDRVPAVELPEITTSPNQSRYRGIERMKDQLVEQGFTEVSTQSFTKKGDVILANPLDKTRPALRTSLEETLDDARARAQQYLPLVMPPRATLKLFEVGSVFPKAGEYLELRMTERVLEWGNSAGVSDNLSIAKLEEYGKDYAPKRYALSAYKPFSLYPFIIRDVALWVPEVTDPEVVMSSIAKNAGSLLVKCELFDTFSKDGRKSYAFRLLFQSNERTLTDEEINSVMEKVTAALIGGGFEVR